MRITHKCNILVGIFRRKGLLGRYKLKWKDTTKMDLREIGYEGLNWIKLAQDGAQFLAFMRTVLKFRGP
jgi:hypothetical protein